MEKHKRDPIELILEEHIHESRAQLAFLKARVETVKPDAEAEYFGHIESLERLMDIGMGRMEALRTAPDEFWGVLLGPAQASCDELKAAISDTRLHYFPTIA